METRTEAPEAAPIRSYRSSYYARKDEIAQLEKEAGRLAKRLEQLKAAEQGDVMELVESVQENAALTSGLQASAWVMAEAQSVLSNRLVVNPLDTFIRLPVEAVAREKALYSIRDAKLHMATEFLLRRSRYMDLRSSHRQVESATLPNGDVVVEEFAVEPFPETSDVKQVYDALQLALAHHQFVIWERLGFSAVCEVGGGMEESVCQLRCFTKVLPGMDMEKNTASFSQYYENSGLLSCPYGLVVVDFVNEDELYPYHRESRVRLDTSGVTMVCRTSSDPTSSVSLVRWTYTRIHRPHDGVPQQSINCLRDCIPRGTDATIEAVREYITPTEQILAADA
ncbi:hypothetical protein Poli38472_012205 [Pythium oligandrum]|uniref:Uncharacterized protein n=1 Tax=Pythium oligandrum TaxID=41045 RepID=A0A8K1CP81_PYTOL|nr:hypothetical protein Poli38472_012205 [Pythium oligandrum]|eukprot:TMW67089.1 hypothetical protein Poli38472_012205 [Pythium oligandrum]